MLLSRFGFADVMLSSQIIIKRNILVFKHMPSQNPGIFRDYAEILGIKFTEIDLHANDKIPDITLFDGLWVMGGAMDVWEENIYPWLIEEKQVIRQAVEELAMPFLGICLGHQLLAEAMGGKVDKTPCHEVGLFDVYPTLDGQNHPLLTNLPNPSSWVNVHFAEVTRAPKRAVVLAESKVCRNHLMQVGQHAYSCQFHPEVCAHTVDEWLKIPGFIDLMEDRFGPDAIADFSSSINDNLPSHNSNAFLLFKNWFNLVFH